MSRFTTYQHVWPVFITVVPPTFDLDDIEAYIAEVGSLYTGHQRFASLCDTSQVTAIPGAAERKRLVDWQNETVELIRRHNVFTATVIESALLRGAMTAMNWLFRPPNEQLVVGSFAEGFVLCVDHLIADGQRVSPELERMARRSPPSRVEDTLPAR